MMELVAHAAEKMFREVKSASVRLAVDFFEKKPQQALGELFHPSEEGKITDLRIQNALAYPNGVIIDDEGGVGEYWSLVFKNRKLKFFQLEQASDFLMLSPGWNRETLLYVDWMKEEGDPRRKDILRLMELGFTRITVITEKYLSQKSMGLPRWIGVMNKNDPEEKFFD
jgi:hypothetical protein